MPSVDYPLFSPFDSISVIVGNYVAVSTIIAIAFSIINTQAMESSPPNFRFSYRGIEDINSNDGGPKCW